MAANSYLVVKFDGGAPATTNFSGGVLNTGFGFDAGGDKVLLYDKPSRGGSLMDSVAFGLLAADSRCGVAGARLYRPWKIQILDRCAERVFGVGG